MLRKNDQFQKKLIRLIKRTVYIWETVSNFVDFKKLLMNYFDMIRETNMQISNSIGNPFEMPIEAQPDVAKERSFLTQITPDTDPQAIPTKTYKRMAAHPPAPAL